MIGHASIWRQLYSRAVCTARPNHVLPLWFTTRPNFTSGFTGFTSLPILQDRRAIRAWVRPLRMPLLARV